MLKFFKNSLLTVVLGRISINMTHKIKSTKIKSFLGVPKHMTIGAIKWERHIWIMKSTLNRGKEKVRRTKESCHFLYFFDNRGKTNADSWLFKTQKKFLIKKAFIFGKIHLILRFELVQAVQKKFKLTNLVFKLLLIYPSLLTLIRNQVVLLVLKTLGSD